MEIKRRYIYLCLYDISVNVAIGHYRMVLTLRGRIDQSEPRLDARAARLNIDSAV